MGELSEFQVGQTVELQDGRTATVRFVGETHFAPGDWIGVELNEATGKNDGAVQGQRYFDCGLGHGMFVKPVVATVIDQPVSKQNGRFNGKANGAPTKARPQSTVVAPLKRQSILDPAVVKRQSINGNSPTPGAKTGPAPRTLRSPSKSPTKQLGSTTSSSNATPQTSAPLLSHKPTTVLNKPRNSIAGRPSMVPPTSATSRGSRQSVAGTLNGAAKAPARTAISSSRGASNRLSIQVSSTKRFSSINGGSHGSGPGGLESPAESQEHEMLSPPISEYPDDRSRSALSPALSPTSTASRAISSSKVAPSHGRASPTGAQRAPPSSTASSREIEDLKTRLSMAEKKRLEDREKLKALEKIQSDRDKFEGIIQRLEGKLQPQQQEIASLKKQLREAEAKVEAVETQQAENDTAVEMATLDREMAEETAESFKTELDALRQRNEELELEVEILKEENAELGKEMSPEERTSQGWLQIERSNERLREALLRLRDVAQQQESELKQQIRELERDVQDLTGVTVQYEEAKERLAQSNAAIEDLRQQLDTALGAEEMIEELTDKNMSLNEQLDDLRAAVEDLESLKELNDELELNHTETEKQMQDEIDYKDSMLVEQLRKSVVQDETIDDLEYTVARFRELVTNLQSALEDMRTSQQITETQANELTARSRAMMDLNMRLQVSASKTQVKTIDLELRRLEAQESAEHLAIVHLFLPETFDNDRDSVFALLRFKRIGFKASLLHGFIKERVNGPAFPGHEDDIFACCDILDQLIWIKTTCDRFVSYIESCSIEAFSRLEGALYDLEPVERAFNNWIDGLKKDELKEQQCAVELHRSVALMTHLAEVHISQDLEQHAEDIHMRAQVMQSNLETAAVAMSHVKSMAQSKLLSSSDEGNEVVEDAETFLQRADSLISQIRTTKVICSKAIHQLEELKSRSLTLDPSTLPTIEQSQLSTSELTSTTRSIGLSLFELINQEGRTLPFTCNEIIGAMCSNDTLPFSSLSSRIHTTTTQIQIFHNLTTTLSQSIEFPSPPRPPPWQILAKNIRAATATSASHETEVSQLRDELVEKNTAMTMKDKIVEEMSVKVEVLEKRVCESGGRRERVRELEKVVEVARANERELVNKLKRLEQDLQALESERESWKKQAALPGHHPGAQTSSQPSVQSGPTPAATLRNISQLESEISTLHSTIRYLRLSTHQTSLSSAHSFLYVPLIPPTTQPTQSASLAYETRGLLKEMLNLVARPENQVVQLVAREKDARLQWRPAKESLKWQLGRQREEWETWREWKEDVVSQVGRQRREEERKREVRGREKGVDVLARVGFALPNIDLGEKRLGSAEVKIVRPDEWEELERGLGVA